MEKDIHNEQKAFDQLLKEAFINLDETKLSNQKLNDMLANAIMNNGPVTGHDPGKENDLFNKLNGPSTHGFISSNRYWLGISGMAIIAITAVIFYFQFVKEGDRVSGQILPVSDSNDILPEQNILPILRDSVMPTAEDPGNITINTPTKTPAVLPKTIKAMEEATPEQVNVPQKEPENVILGSKQRVYTQEETIPVLTDEDKKQNKRRKEAMVKNVVKPRKMEWIRINPTVPGMVKEYYMNAVEITNIQYKTFLMDLIEQNRIEDYKIARTKGVTWKEIGIPGFENTYFYDSKYDKNAVVNILPEGMAMYAEWLSELVNTSKQNRSATKYHLRLPTEQEWKYACTSEAVPEPVYTNGLNMIINQRACMLANFKPLPQKGELVSNPNYKCEDSTLMVTGNSKYCTKLNDSTLYYVVMVYAFNPSHRGIYCMAGNVSEVVKKNNGQYRSIGGNWNSTSTYLKVNAPDEFEGRSLQNPFVGFRLVYTKE